MSISHELADLPSLPPKFAAREFVGPSQRVHVDRDGLTVGSRLVWWEEVRRVEWLGYGQARLYLLDGHLDLDEHLAGLRELVALVETAAAAARAAWREHSLSELKLAHWFGTTGRALPIARLESQAREQEGFLRAEFMGRPLLLLAALAVLVWVFVTYAIHWGRGAVVVGGAIAGLGGVLASQVRAAWLTETGEPRLTRVLLFPFRFNPWFIRPPEGEFDDVAGPVPVFPVLSVTVYASGLRCGRERVAWHELHGVHVDEHRHHGELRVWLQLVNRWLRFDLCTHRAPKAAWAFRLLASLTTGHFAPASEEPLPASALSLARGPGAARDADRGLSRTFDGLEESGR